MLLIGAGARADEPQFPAFTGYVVDNAGLLSTATRQQLSEALGEFQRATKRQVVVATVKSLQGLPIEDYGYRLGRAWGVGQRGEDTGAILLVAPNERQVRIEVGYGLEGELTDARSKQIIEQVILPAFRTGDYNRGVVAGTAAILRVLGAPTGTGTALGARGEQQTGVTGSRPGDLWGFLLPLLIFGIFAFLRSHSYGRRSAAMAPIIWGRGFGGGFGSGSGFGGGGFGGGFGGGGGGSFGGGGASGRW
jgi:uncharacterized protein